MEKRHSEKLEKLLEKIIKKKNGNRVRHLTRVIANAYSKKHKELEKYFYDNPNQFIAGIATSAYHFLTGDIAPIWKIDFGGLGAIIDSSEEELEFNSHQLWFSGNSEYALTSSKNSGHALWYSENRGEALYGSKNSGRALRHSKNSWRTLWNSENSGVALRDSENSGTALRYSYNSWCSLLNSENSEHALRDSERSLFNKILSVFNKVFN